MDYLALINEKEQEEQQLYQRMQADANMLHLEKFTLKDPSGTPIPDIVNVTLNRPAILAANVISSLGKVIQQIIVESEDLSIDTHSIEHFQKTAFMAANHRLMKQARPTLDVFADTQFCMRGRTGRRILFREENGEIVPDISNWDGRYMRYEMGPNGPLWAAYVMERNRDIVEAQYGLVTHGKVAKVCDVWDPWHNEVLVDGKIVFEQEHDCGETPVAIEVVPLGYGDILLDQNRIKRQGESIFFLIRDIVPQLNMLISILQTLNLKLVKNPMQFANREGVHGDPPEYEDAMGMGSITSVDVGGGITPVTYGDARNAAQMAYGIMEKAIQEGGYTDIDVGNVRQPFSAVALITIGENKDQVYLPRLAAKENLNVQTANMITRQVRQMGGTVKLGIPGHMESFKTKELEGEYTTSYRYHVKDPKTDIARMAVAQVAERYYPREIILSDILQVEDPEGVERAWLNQEAGIISPNVKRHRIIMALLEEAERGDENAAVEAKILEVEQGVAIDQVRQGNLPQVAGPPGPSTTLPLMGSASEVPAPTGTNQSGENGGVNA